MEGGLFSPKTKSYVNYRKRFVREIPAFLGPSRSGKGGMPVEKQKMNNEILALQRISAICFAAAVWSRSCVCFGGPIDKPQTEDRMKWNFKGSV